MMNDFTKDELLIIHLDMTIYAEKTPLLKESPSHKALRDKIQSMIDNYSDKKCQHNFMLCQYLYGEPDNKYRCTKCLMMR